MRTWRLDVGAVSLAVTEYGDPSLPAAVVAHGVGSTGEFAARCFAGPLAVAGYRLVAYDLRGHGASTPLPDPADHALAHHASDLAAVMEATGARVAGGLSLGAHAAHAVGADRLLLAIPGQLGVAPRYATLAEIVGVPGVPRWVVGELRRAWPQHDPASLAAALAAVAAERPTTHPRAQGVAAVAHDPVHPLHVAETMGERVVTITMAEWGADRAAIGRAALSASR